jgi:glutaconyl-CoA/methylmalonyl-CoA decarboxylase subunit gamma
MMIYIVKINDKEYEVEVEKGKANLIKVTDAVAQAPVMEAVTAASPAAQTPAPAVPVNNADGEPVKAPMPGTILDIKVSSGSKVKRGELLFILEAMKMENEVFAPTDGIISQVMVTKGASVITGDIVMLIR